MTEDKNTGIIFGVIIGAIIMAAILLSRKSSPALIPPKQNAQQLDWKPIDIPRVDDILSVQSQPTQIQQQTPIVQAPISKKIDSSIIKMTSQLEKATYQLENATSILQQTVSKMQNTSKTIQPIYQLPPQPPQVFVQPMQQQTNQLTPIAPMVQTQQTVRTQQSNIKSEVQTDVVQPSNTIYKNSEKWKIIRGPDGRIKSLEIVRDVKKSK